MRILFNFLKISGRLFLKRKGFVFIVIACLTLGFSAFLTLYDYISFEYSYDKFNSNADKIYRVQLERTYSDRVDLTAGVSAGVGPAMKASFPEVEAYTKLWGTKHLRNIFEQGENFFEAEKLYFASKDFFKVFSFKLIEGDKETSLSKPNTVVITASLATKIFGTIDPMGKTIVYHNPWGATPLKVTGIAEDSPENSHLKFTALVSFVTLENFISEAKDSFGWSAFNTYLLLKDGASIQDLQSKVKNFVSTNYKPLFERGIKVRLIFQPLIDVHLGPVMRFQPEPGGDKQVLKTLSIAAFFILILAWLNYINISTANASVRAREVAIRKVSGASAKNLIIQFLLEAFLLNLFSIIISLMLVEMSEPYLSNLIGKELPGTLYLRPDIWVLVSILVLGGTLFSGLYPALSLSSFRPATVLKGEKIGTQYFNLRRILVVFQLIVSFILISGTLVLYNQIKFMQNRNLGLNLKQVLVVKGPGITDSTTDGRIEFFKQELVRDPLIQSVSNTTAIPGGEISWVNNDVRWLGSGNDDRYSMPFTGVSAEYPQLMGLRLIAGRQFIKGKPGEEEKIILTERAAKVLGFKSADSAIGEQVDDSGQRYTVIGVFRDFHQQSLSKEIDPVIFRYVSNANSYLVLKVEAGQLQKTISLVEKQWKASFPGNPFDYFFLDDYFDMQYKQDIQFAEIFGIFSSIGIAIGALGLFALSLFMIRRRVSEVSIRKVMGATEYQIIKLFSAEFFRIILMAGLVGSILSWMLSTFLLNDYQYKISFQWTMILFPFAILLSIIILTTGWQIMKISRNNPVDTIRDQQ